MASLWGLQLQSGLPTESAKRTEKKTEENKLKDRNQKIREKKGEERKQKMTKDNKREEKKIKRMKRKLKWGLCDGRPVCVVGRPVCVIADQSVQKCSPILTLWNSISDPTGLRVAYRDTQKTPQSQTSLQNSRPVCDCDILGVLLCAICRPVGSYRPV